MKIENRGNYRTDEFALTNTVYKLKAGNTAEGWLLQVVGLSGEPQGILLSWPSVTMLQKFLDEVISKERGENIKIV